jgi:hypothetical protein
MNIFYLSKDPMICAREHCDKHVVKMILEYAQLLSTAHRVLDGIEELGKSSSGRTIKRYILNDMRNKNIYEATHLSHPSSLWTRQSSQHYEWLFHLFEQCCVEYTRRYNKTHKTSGLAQYLAYKPYNIPENGWCEPPPAMPEKYKILNDSIQSYRNYYIGEKIAFAKWREPATTPKWFLSIE